MRRWPMRTSFCPPLRSMYSGMRKRGKTFAFWVSLDFPVVLRENIAWTLTPCTPCYFHPIGDFARSYMKTRFSMLGAHRYLLRPRTLRPAVLFATFPNLAITTNSHSARSSYTPPQLSTSVFPPSKLGIWTLLRIRSSSGRGKHAARFLSLRLRLFPRRSRSMHPYRYLCPVVSSSLSLFAEARSLISSSVLMPVYSRIGRLGNAVDER